MSALKSLLAKTKSLLSASADSEPKIPAITQFHRTIYWDQPNKSRIKWKKGIAYTKREHFYKLADCSTYDPAVLYPGKMWRCAKDPTDPDAGWYLCWVDNEEQINSRTLIVKK